MGSANDIIKALWMDESHTAMDLYTSRVEEILDLFYPQTDSTLIYHNTGIEVLICYLLHNFDDCENTKLMNYNTPMPDILFIPRNEGNVKEGEMVDVMSRLQKSPYPVILDSHVSGAHHKIWKGHGLQQNKDNILDMKCRDAFGTFPNIAFTLSGPPEETRKVIQDRCSRSIIPSDIADDLLSSHCYQVYVADKDVKQYVNFYNAEMILFKALPISYIRAYIHIHIFCCLHLHYEFTGLSRMLLHAIFWAYEHLTSNPKADSQEIAKHVLNLLLEEDVVNYFLPTQPANFPIDRVEGNASLKEELSSTQNELFDCVSLCSAFNFSDKSQDSQEGFKQFMQDRLVCAVKLNILRLRKHLCDSGLQTCQIEKEWLEMKSKDESHAVLNKVLESWELSMKLGKSKHKTEEELCSLSLPVSLQSWRVIEASIAYRKGNYGKAFELVAPIVSAVCGYLDIPSSLQCGDDNHDKICEGSPLDLAFLATYSDLNLVDMTSSAMTDATFLKGTLLVQALSLFVISDLELDAHVDFIKSEEVRLATSPLAGEMVNNSTGVFFLPVIAACVGALAMWQESRKSSEGLSHAVELLNWAEHVIRQLEEEPWDGNEKRTSAHYNILGRCYLQLASHRPESPHQVACLDGAERAFTFSNRTFPRLFSNARSLQQRVRKQRQQQEAGSNRRAWMVAALCGVVAVGVGLLRVYAK